MSLEPPKLDRLLQPATKAEVAALATATRQLAILARAMMVLLPASSDREWADEVRGMIQQVDDDLLRLFNSLTRKSDVE